MLKYFLIFFLTILFLACGENKKTENEASDVKENVAEHPSSHKEQWQDHTQTQSIIESGNFDLVADKIIGLSSEENKKFTTPIFSNDGSKVFYSTTNFNEIWATDIASNKSKMIVTKSNCGNGFQISNDDKFIIFREKSRPYKIYKYDLASEETAVLYESNNRISTPTLIENEIYFLENNQPKRINISGGKLVEKFTSSFLYLKNGKLYKYQNSEELIKVADDFKLLSLKYTADKENISLLTDKGIMLLTNSGRLKNLFADAVGLTKLSNSKLVFISKEKNDGMTITNMELFFGFINSSDLFKFNIDENVFNPSVSSFNNNLAFSDDSGKIKLVNFNIEKRSK